MTPHRVNYCAHDGEHRTEIRVIWESLPQARSHAAGLCGDRSFSGVRLRDADGTDVAIWPRPDAVEAATGVKGSPEHHRASHGAVCGDLEAVDEL
jgi:hypothetical protein